MIPLDFGYITSCLGILKILEFVCLCIAWSCLVNVTTHWEARYKTYRQIVFLGVTVTAWVIVIIWFCCYVFMICGKFSFPSKLLIFGIFHLILSVLLLISGAILADDAANLTRRRCFVGNYCEVYEVAAAFGLISAALFLIDAFYHWQISKREITGTSSGKGGTRTVTKQTRTVVTTTY